MSLDDVQSALTEMALIALQGIPVAMENAPFIPPNGTKWAALNFIPNDPSVFTLGSEGRDAVDGILQIDLTYPQGAGTEPARKDFEHIRSFFPAGSRPQYNDQEVIIMNCGRSRGRIVEKTSYRISITIYWYGYIGR